MPDSSGFKAGPGACPLQGWSGLQEGLLFGAWGEMHPALTVDQKFSSLRPSRHWADLRGLFCFLKFTYYGNGGGKAKSAFALTTGNLSPLSCQRELCMKTESQASGRAPHTKNTGERNQAARPSRGSPGSLSSCPPACFPFSSIASGPPSRHANLNGSL